MRVCKICVAEFGFKLSDREKAFETDEELCEHMEDFHGAIVKREGETTAQAKERCRKKGIVEDRSMCQCEECKLLRSEESRITLTGFSQTDVHDLFRNLN